MREKRIWITWENQRRNKELSKVLNARLYQIDEVDRIYNRIKKYCYGINRTIRIMINEWPKVTFCQNPSIVLSLLMVFIRSIFRTKVIIDAHNAGIYPLEGTSRFLNFISRYIQRKADLTIITNKALKSEVDKNNGRGFVLQDKIPDLPIMTPVKLKGKNNILFVCTFGADEPFRVVIDAARQIEDNIHIYITGRHEKTFDKFDNLPKNITLTGFIPEADYIQLLHTVDAVLVLTTRENCLVCGAYEAVSARKPLILSDTRALKSYFYKGVIFTKHQKKEIAESIRKAIQNKALLRRDIEELRKELDASWVKRREALEKIIVE